VASTRTDASAREKKQSVLGSLGDPPRVVSHACASVVPGELDENRAHCTRSKVYSNAIISNCQVDSRPG